MPGYSWTLVGRRTWLLPVVALACFAWFLRSRSMPVNSNGANGQGDSGATIDATGDSRRNRPGCPLRAAYSTRPVLSSTE